MGGLLLSRKGVKGSFKGETWRSETQNGDGSMKHTDLEGFENLNIGEVRFVDEISFSLSDFVGGAGILKVFFFCKTDLYLVERVQ